MLSVLHSAFGFLALIGIAWLLSENRRTVPWRIVISGILLQIVLAALLFKMPLFIRPYLARMSRSELFMVMTGGMAGIAGTVMVLYASLLGPVVPDAMGHILSAAIISAPAALVMAALMVPPQEAPTAGSLSTPQPARGAMDAVTRGTVDGLALLLNIVALGMRSLVSGTLATLATGAVAGIYFSA